MVLECPYVMVWYICEWFHCGPAFFLAALSVFVCGISAFLIRIVPPSEGVIVILSSVFNGVAVFGWNALDVISTSNIFPVHLR